ncbi:hypothetical protein CRENBAI_021840 [Crenichthys baileyi]|uniref:Uncharacterized protein n=1 Tax=Crenichthys baileyi TaxID=28760 RepID=A0AAV9RIF0_9TELE
MAQPEQVEFQRGLSEELGKSLEFEQGLIPTDLSLARNGTRVEREEPDQHHDAEVILAVIKAVISSYSLKESAGPWEGFKEGEEGLDIMNNALEESESVDKESLMLKSLFYSNGGVLACEVVRCESPAELSSAGVYTATMS